MLIMINYWLSRVCLFLSSLIFWSFENWHSRTRTNCSTWSFKACKQRFARLTSLWFSLLTRCSSSSTAQIKANHRCLLFLLLFLYFDLLTTSLLLFHFQFSLKPTIRCLNFRSFPRIHLIYFDSIFNTFFLGFLLSSLTFHCLSVTLIN